MFGKKAKRIRELEDRNDVLEARVDRILFDKRNDANELRRLHGIEKLSETQNAALAEVRRQADALYAELKQRDFIIDQLRTEFTSLTGEYTMYQIMMGGKEK
jgi:predicted RNase H-like nuclease (RuvC/YqgF family)